MTSPRLIYRRPTLADLPHVFAIYSDPQTHRFNPAGPLTHLEQAQRMLEAWIEHWHVQGYGWWAVAERAMPGQPIGFGGVACYSYLGEPRLNLGYRFAVQAWGKGYATELGHATLAHAFATPGIEQVWALVRPSHAASIRVLEKIGMRRCGLLDDVPGQPASQVFEISKDTQATPAPTDTRTP